ncbi:ASPIC/UnbV domain-containing protein [candidate division KSB1 bacterium]|nr:ASPIC/UnbV domain-containing protein [candidate division KSB1 bacterium]
MSKWTYHNIGAKPGLWIQLVDSNGNIAGIGATIRIKFANHYGPAREIHAGSGYWSQDSMIQVLGLQEEVKGIWIRWPGGIITETKIVKISNEITINSEGRIVNYL